MENSFFEYRDRTGAASESDSEIIDNSFSQELIPKTPAKKNQTVYVPESDDSIGDDSEKENTSVNIFKSVPRRSSVNQHHIVLSSDDDKSSKGSIQRHSESSNKVVITSSDDEAGQVSPEIIPKRRPLVKPSPRSSDSFIGRKKKKHMILIDSESDSSFIKERTRKKKCLKDTPIKIDSDREKVLHNIQNMSIQNDSISSNNDTDQSDHDEESQNSDDSSESDIENKSHEEDVSESENDISDTDNQDHKNGVLSNNNANKKKQGHENKGLNLNHVDNKRQSVLSDKLDTSLNEVSNTDNNDHLNEKSNENQLSDQSDNIQPSINEVNITKQSDVQSYTYRDSHCSNENANETSSSNKKDSVISSGLEDDGLEEEQMVMSRATRMSIMGIIPKENESDESDFIESDDTAHSSRASSTGNLYLESDLQEHSSKTPEKVPNVNDTDTSRITCSPITSPVHENGHINRSLENDAKATVENPYSPEICGLMNKGVQKENEPRKKYKEKVIDDDVTIIDREPEIIALSSDDEVEVKEDKSPHHKKSSSDKKTPSAKKSPRPKEESTTQFRSNDIKQYLAPPSYPNQVVYVKKHVRENELSKLNGLREDLQNIRYLLEHMDVETLPDRGAKLIERLDTLERDVQAQGDKVASMVVEPDIPTPEQISQDGFATKKGLSWDEIQKASNAVQPRMFGKQAMSTHMAERNHILERLRDLYESLASRPSEDKLAKQPASVKTELMQHQLHALAWLNWRETQKPSGGILADDMGLGKTITMISLIAADKEGSIDHDDNDDEDGRERRLVRGGTLVVCPATLVQQWANEVSKHCTSHALSVCLHHGTARATQPHRLAASDLVITTYNILQRESENGVLSRIRWRRVILDEAHVVRNHKSATSQGVCGLRSPRRWALTGTPVHNKDLDIFTLLKFLRCTPFDDLAMWKKWIDHKSWGGSERLNTIMSCVMLRRTKQQLQERGQLTCLPERTSHDVSVTLQQDEMNVYQKVLVFSKTLFAQFLHQRAEKASGLQGLEAAKKNSEYAKMHKKMVALQGVKPVKSHEILVLLLRLRQVCCHCGLISAMLDNDNDTELAEDAGSQDLLAELNKLTLEDNNASRRKSGSKRDEEEEESGESTTAAEAIKSVLSSNNPVFDLQRRSSKIKAVMECLNKNVFKNKGDKAVVVSQWTSVLNLMERELKSAGIRSVTLRGDVPVTARAPLITALNDTNSDVRVMLLSLCAGGVGINLCGANHLLLLDPHWNPQLEEQAQDRIYRVGQRKPVHVYKFMCVNTVEQKIRQMQKEKLELADNVLTGAKNSNGSKLSIEELKILFNMGSQGGS